MSMHNPIFPADGCPLSLVGAFIRRTSLDRAILVAVDLNRTDLTGATARDADFEDAILKKTVLRGVGLTGAKNLRLEQLAQSIIDEHTILPDYIDRAALKQKMRAKTE